LPGGTASPSISFTSRPRKSGERDPGQHHPEPGKQRHPIVGVRQVSSVLGLPFVFLPAPVTALAAAVVLVAPHVVGHPLLDAPELYFLGLGRGLPDTNDWVPLFPWFGMVPKGKPSTLETAMQCRMPKKM
jgi:hypothetical protein